MDSDRVERSRDFERFITFIDALESRSGPGHGEGRTPVGVRPSSTQVVR